MAVDTEKQVCSVCGGDNVQVLAWVDANNHEFDDEGPCDENHTWCTDCEAHHLIVSESEFEEDGK